MDSYLLSLHIEMSGTCFCIQDISMPSVFTSLGYGCYMSVLKMGDISEYWDSKLV